VVVTDKAVIQDTKSTKESLDSEPQSRLKSARTLTGKEMYQILVEKSCRVKPTQSSKNDSLSTNLTSQSTQTQILHPPMLPRAAHPEIIDLTDTSSESGEEDSL
jgi:hypothetical protein